MRKGLQTSSHSYGTTHRTQEMFNVLSTVLSVNGTVIARIICRLINTSYACFTFYRLCMCGGRNLISWFYCIYNAFYLDLIFCSFNCALKILIFWQTICEISDHFNLSLFCWRILLSQLKKHTYKQTPKNKNQKQQQYQ